MKHRSAAILLMTACGSPTGAPPADAPAGASAGPAATVPPPPPTLAKPVKDGPASGPASGPAALLPPKEDLRAPDVPATYEDGAYSIRGLREDPDPLLAEADDGRELLVRAYVQETYTPPACPPGQTCPIGKMPHAWLIDAPDVAGRRHAMMVVNYAFMIPEFQAEMWKDAPAVALQVGKQYTFRGKFARFSDTGFSDPRGLLDFVAYRAEDGTWVYPPGAPWHPLALAEVEKLHKRLAGGR